MLKSHLSTFTDQTVSPIPTGQTVSAIQTASASADQIMATGQTTASMDQTITTTPEVTLASLGLGPTTTQGEMGMETLAITMETTTLEAIMEMETKETIMETETMEATMAMETLVENN